MPVKCLKIEISGICFKVNIENHPSFSQIKSIYADFLSKKRQDVTIDLRDYYGKVSIKKSVIRDIDNAYKNLLLIKEGNDLFLTPKTDSSMCLGVIYVKEKRCVVYDLFKGDPGALFSVFLMHCLKVFLGNSSGFIIHACGLADNNNGYVFIGPSGSGKTTVAGKSRHLILLSDELVCVRGLNKSFYVYGTIWGKGCNKYAKIKKAFFLVKDKSVKFKRLTPAAAAGKIIENSSLGNLTTAIVKNALNTVTELTKAVSCYNMYFPLRGRIWKEIGDLKD